MIRRMAWDGAASNYSDSQYQAACVLDRKVCGDEGPPKSRCSLPIKAPGSDSVDPDGLAAAAQRVGSVQACPAAVSAAKAKLRSAYKTLGKEPPPSLKASAPRMTFEQARQAQTTRWLLNG
jgi:hypothetical protein